MGRQRSRFFTQATLSQPPGAYFSWQNRKIAFLESKFFWGNSGKRAGRIAQCRPRDGRARSFSSSEQRGDSRGDVVPQQRCRPVDAA
jgi:hypothetical protein